MRILKHQLLTSALIVFTTLAHAQIANDFMIGVSADLVKTDTDTDGLFQKVQTGAEINYFLHRKFTVSSGIDVWTGSEDKVSFVIGGRWFPTDEFFVRARGLIGQNDVNIGGGWTLPLDENFKFEAIGDFYFHGDFSIRAGVNYIFRQKI